MSAAMKCGHVATGTHGGEPVCVSCFGLEPGAVIVDFAPPNLAGRIARCQYDGQIEKNGCGCNGCKGCRCQQPSGGDLAFFEYRGPRSPYATEDCICGYTATAHTPEMLAKPHLARIRTGTCKGVFTPRGPAEYDAYFCGCAGFD